MKPQLIILVAMWPFYSAASASCDLEKAKAEVAASLAGAPRAFASVGEATSSEKNAVVGMSSSLAGHRSASLLRQAAEHGCSAIAAAEVVEQHLAFSELALKRAAAKAELPVVEKAITHTDQLVKRLTAQFAAKTATLSVVVEAQQRLLTLQQKQAELLSVLSKQGEHPAGNISGALSAARFHEAEAARLQAEAQAVRGWDVVVSAGARRPLNGGTTEPFASISFTWSLGERAASKAASEVGRLSEQSAAERKLGATQLVIRREQELETELKIIDRRIADLLNARKPVEQGLAKLAGLDSAEAIAVRDSLILNELQLEAEQARLLALHEAITGLLAQLR